MSFKGQEEISSLVPALVNSSGDGGRLQRIVPLRGRPAAEVIALLYEYSLDATKTGRNMRGRPVYPTWQTRRLPVRAALILVALACYMRPGLTAEISEGRAILERNCGRCHAVAAGDASPLKEAPNLAIVLGSYPGERLELELGEGIGSRHRDMPQIQFSAEEITSIYYYLHGTEPDLEYRRPQ